jgi:excisionase family DNA binding protein
MNAAEHAMISLPVCTTSEAARRLGVSSTTVQVMVERGELKAWRTRGGHRRISLDSVESVQRQRGGVIGGARPTYAPLCVLVVEAGDSAGGSCTAALQSWGWSLQVLRSADPIDALLQIERRRPDVLIIDLDMPGIDGQAFLRGLRAHGEFDAMQVVVVTDKPASLQATLRDGIVGVAVYPKPVSLEKLQGFIEAHLLRHPVEPAVESAAVAALAESAPGNAPMQGRVSEPRSRVAESPPVGPRPRVRTPRQRSQGAAGSAPAA